MTPAHVITCVYIPWQARYRFTAGSVQVRCRLSTGSMQAQCRLGRQQGYVQQRRKGVHRAAEAQGRAWGSRGSGAYVVLVEDTGLQVLEDNEPADGLKPAWWWHRG